MTPAVNPIRTLELLIARVADATRRIGVAQVTWGVLGFAFISAAAMILVWGRGQTFISDEWSYLVVARGWSIETLFTPQNGHLILIPRLIYKGLFATVGADSHLPYQLVAIALHFTVSLLFFLLVRTRLTALPALALTVLVIFLGAGWDTVMGTYEIPNLIGMASGLGTLLLLERRTFLCDIGACLVLAVSLSSFGVGIAFAIGVGMSIWLAGRGQWMRAWIVLGPALLYIVWFVWARKFDQSDVTLAAISSILSGIADQLAAICAAITGLFRTPGNADLATTIQIRPEWGYPLALVFVALVALHVGRAPRSIRFWVVTATLLAYLALVASGLDPARAPNASRYVYMGSILTLLLVAELARDIKWSTATSLLAAALFGLALMANVAELRAGGRLFAAEGATNRATLAALELSGEQVDPNLPVEDANTTHSHPDMLFPAFAYFDMIDEYGSPAFSLSQLAAADEQSRQAADQQLLRTLGIEAAPNRVPLLRRSDVVFEPLDATAGRIANSRACLELLPDEGQTAVFQFVVPPGGFSYRVSVRAEVGLRIGRFADLIGEPLAPVAGSAEVAIPMDRSNARWRAEFQTGEKALVCPR